MTVTRFDEERFPSVERLIDALVEGNTPATFLGDAVLAHPACFADDGVLALLETRRRLRTFGLTLLVTPAVEPEYVVLRRATARHRAPPRAD